jgi:hypothetical protein
MGDGLYLTESAWCICCRSGGPDAGDAQAPVTIVSTMQMNRLLKETRAVCICENRMNPYILSSIPSVNATPAPVMVSI